MPLGTEADEKEKLALAKVAQNKLDLEAALAHKARIRRPVVTAFGRFATDKKLLAYVQHEAVKRKASAVVFPIANTAQRSLPQFSTVLVNRNDRVRSLPDALVALSLMGFDAAYVVVTRDQMSAVPTIKAMAKGLKFKELGVLPVLTELFTENVELVRPAARKRLKEGKAFVLYAMTKTDAQTLHEAFVKHVRCPRVPMSDLYSARTKHLMETGTPLFIDASGLPLSDIDGVHKLLERADYATYIYVKEMTLPKVITEAWVKNSSAYGLLREKYARDLCVLSADASPDLMVEHVWRVLTESEAAQPKQPTEVDQLQQKDKQETLLLKKRQSDELLGAKTRELEKKSADDMAKLNAPKTAKA
jgi:hypothetical protein